MDTSSYVQVTARRHHTDAVGHITSRYEDKIRYFANSDKVFRYFATVKVDGVVYMRPQDFIRSVTPGEMQPEGAYFAIFTNFMMRAGSGCVRMMRAPLDGTQRAV